MSALALPAALLFGGPAPPPVIGSGGSGQGPSVGPIEPAPAIPGIFGAGPTLNPQQPPADGSGNPPAGRTPAPPSEVVLPDGFVRPINGPVVN